jgi:CRP-like cAMP-binding protein
VSTAHSKRALSEKEATVKTVADGQNYADMLGAIPALSSCAKDVLDDFVSGGVFTMRSVAGEDLLSDTPDDFLYVLVVGSASLYTGDVRVTLKPGDYFGGDSSYHYSLTSASVVADDYVEVLVIAPQEIVQLLHASSRSRHPSNIEWSARAAAPAAKFVRRRTRRPVLAGSPS